jgi:hypothetical protein
LAVNIHNEEQEEEEEKCLPLVLQYQHIVEVLRTGPEENLRTSEKIGSWRTFHNGELHNLYSPPSIRMSSSRKVRWAGHAACME